MGLEENSEEVSYLCEHSWARFAIKCCIRFISKLIAVQFVTLWYYYLAILHSGNFSLTILLCGNLSLAILLLEKFMVMHFNFMAALLFDNMGKLELGARDSLNI